MTRWQLSRKKRCSGEDLPEFEVGHEFLHGHVVQKDEIRLPELQALVLGHDATPVCTTRTAACEAPTGALTSAEVPLVSGRPSARCASAVLRKSQTVNPGIFDTQAL